jgi:hypothetical protein
MDVRGHEPIFSGSFECCSTPRVTSASGGFPVSTGKLGVGKAD